jgi:hypothetical protein
MAEGSVVEEDSLRAVPPAEGPLGGWEGLGELGSDTWGGEWGLSSPGDADLVFDLF